LAGFWGEWYGQEESSLCPATLLAPLIVLWWKMGEVMWNLLLKKGIVIYIYRILNFLLWEVKV